MNGGIIIPNEDIVLMAEKEEPRFLNIMLKNKDSLQDAISFGIIPSENNQIGHFLNEKNNFLYVIIRTNFLKYGTLLTRSAMDSIVDMMNIGTDEEKASIKSYWDKIWNRHDGALDDYALLRDHMNDRYLLLQFYSQWKRGDQIIKSINGHGELIKSYIGDLNALKNLDPDSYSVTMGLNEGVEEAVKFIEKRRANDENDASIKCDITAIDRIFNGFARPSYTVISGMINGGKTTFMMNVAFNMAKKGYNVAYVSLEKDAKLFFRRTLACHALTDYNRIKVGGTGQWGLTDYWYNKLKHAAQELKALQKNYHCLQFIQDTKLTKILAEVDKLNARKPIDALFVDYLQVIGTETHTIGRYDVDLANVHKRLMGYGRKHNLVIFTALQLKSSSSKDIRKQATKATSESNMNEVTVNTEDYGGSQMIIADADNALGVVLNSDKPPTKMFVSFSKARDDASRKTICLDFNGAVGNICDPEYGAGNVQAVDIDKELFENNISEEDLVNDDKLFEDAEIKNKEENKEISTTTTVTTVNRPDFINEVISESNIIGDSEKEDQIDSPISEESSLDNEPKEVESQGRDIVEKKVIREDDDLFKI